MPNPRLIVYCRANYVGTFRIANKSGGKSANLPRGIPKLWVVGTARCAVRLRPGLPLAQPQGVVRTKPIGPLAKFGPREAPS